MYLKSVYDGWVPTTYVVGRVGDAFGSVFVCPQRESGIPLGGRVNLSHPKLQGYPTSSPRQGMVYPLSGGDMMTIGSP